MMIRDAYGEYTPGPPLPPVPQFPCQQNDCCTAANRLCQAHKFVLFIVVADPANPNWKADLTKFEIPFGNWENFEWYAERISEVSGLSPDSFGIIFAGCERFPNGSLLRHSGLQIQSTLHVVKRKLIDSSVEAEK